MAVTIGQLTSESREHALNLPQVSLMSSVDTDTVLFKVDLLLNQYSVIKHTEPYTKLTKTVQIKDDLYSSSFIKPLTVRRISNLLCSNEEPQVREIATIDKERYSHDMLNYLDKHIILIGGMTEGILGKENYHNSVYRVNLSDGQVSELPGLNKGRANSASCEQNGIIYVAAGDDSKKSLTNTIEVLDLPGGSK